jgi:hypothetical protein
MADKHTFVGIVKERDSDTFARFEIEVEAADRIASANSTST